MRYGSVAWAHNLLKWAWGPGLSVPAAPLRVTRPGTLSDMDITRHGELRVERKSKGKLI